VPVSWLHTAVFSGDGRRLRAVCFALGASPVLHLVLVLYCTSTVILACSADIVCDRQLEGGVTQGAIQV